MRIQTHRLELVPQTLQEVRAQIERMPADQKAELSPAWLAQLDAANVGAWTLGFSIVQRGTDTVIGTCGEGLVAYAFRSGQVRVVRAHTLRDANASTRVLARCGFQAVGEVIDPDDGLVWRWERRHD